MPTFLTLAVFAVTLLLLFVRPRGLQEVWATILSGGLMLVFGLVTWGEAWQTVVQGKDVLFFLFTLMLLSVLLDKSGFFEWAAILARLVCLLSPLSAYQPLQAGCDFAR